MSGADHTWNPSPATRAAGERANVRYALSPLVADGEQRQPAAALVALRDVIVHGVRGVTSGGMVRPSDRRAGVSRDPHRGGIAVDLMLRDDGTRGAVGDALASWLVEHAEALGVQYVLFSHYEWSASHSGPRWEVYTGQDPHLDHVHAELGPDGLALPAEEMTARASRLLSSGGGGLMAWLMGAVALAAGALVIGPRVAARWA